MRPETSAHGSGGRGCGAGVGDSTLGGARLMMALLLVVYVVLAIGYSVATPIYEPTDEIRHFRYVRHLVVYRSLPVQSAEGPRAQSHHPPLYYALGALVTSWVPVEQPVYYEPPRNPHWTGQPEDVSVDNKNQYLHGVEERFPYRGVALAVHVVRWLTVLLGGATVFLTFALGQEVFPGRPSLSLAAAALVAFNPQFLHLSGAINNDVPAALCGAGVLLGCSWLLRRGPDMKKDLLLGTLYGLSLLTKLHLAALILPIGLTYALAARRSRDWRLLLRGPAIVLVLAGAIAGWWFWRNYALYGEPTGMRKLNELWAGRSPAGNWWALRQGLPHLWSSLWGRFGYGQVPLHRGVYGAMLVVCGVAVAGYFKRVADSPGPLLLLLGVTPLVYVAVVFYYILIQPAGAMGRFLFPAFPAFSLLVVSGLGALTPRRLTRALGLGLGAGMAGLAIYALAGVLKPAFGRPTHLTQPQIASVPNPVTVRFGEVGQLLGYQVEPTEVMPGGTVHVTLYWKALARTEQDYTVFVHLLSDVGTMIAQRDTYPGLGRYPTTVWDTGATFADTYDVRIPQTAYAPDTGYIQVGLYLAGGSRLTTEDGRDAVVLTDVEIRGARAKFPNPQDIDFGHRVSLIGYSLDRRRVQPGQTIQLTLYWRALSGMDRDYRAFAHVLDGQDGIRGHSDSLLLDGSVPTGGWEPGRVVREVRVLPVAPDTPAGFYDVEVGLHDGDGNRLPVMADQGHQKGTRVLLSQIAVEPE